MRILIINPYALPPDWGGGTRHYSLSRELLKAGHEVRLCASSFDHVRRRERRLADGQEALLQEEKGVPFLWLRTRPYTSRLQRIRNMRSFAQALHRHAGELEGWQPDVILASTPHLFGAQAALELSERLQVPFVLEVRDIWPRTLVELGGIPSWHPFVLWLGRIERRVCRSATRIISLLPEAWRHFKELGVAPERVDWLPNGVDTRLLPPDRPAPGGRRMKVLYAGAHGLANGLDSIVEAAALLQKRGLADRLEMVFMGEGPEKAALMEKARARRIDLLSFRDSVPKEEVYRELQEADAFIATLKDVPLYRFGISLNKLYDYMACGRPVVFGARSVNNPVAESGGGLSVAPEDAAGMAEAIERLLEMGSEERRAMGAAGREYILQRHTLEQSGKRLEEILSLALSERLTGAASR